MTSSLDPRPVRLYGALLLLGVAAGGALLVLAPDGTSAGAGVATANWVHVGLGAALLLARRWVSPWLRRPFTTAGWAEWLDALRWRNRPPALRPVAFLAAAVAAYLPVRAGAQVLAGLDPDFTRDAWGGPSYLGAAAAHWLDAALLLAAAGAVLGAGHRAGVRAMLAR